LKETILDKVVILEVLIVG